ncbi:MAG: hypothetical protein Q4B60_01190 [Erysipelotrichaceae bacterium]|nr:hypothetical protein [Erysipelotrichaceae bacterium]
MGANTIRVYTAQNPSFYEALYDYNMSHEKPIYILHGVWISDYIQNSRVDAYDDLFFKQFKEDCQSIVDVVHGNKKLVANGLAAGASGTFKKDISKWVLGYIIGIEWEDKTVAYTDNLYKDDFSKQNYDGRFLYTENASAFECMLTQVADSMIAYEFDRYGEQKLMSFSNWPTTDPLDYPEDVTRFFKKSAKVDVEHIRAKDTFKTGIFASYHAYPYFPDYFNLIDDISVYGLNKEDFINEEGVYNSYKAYLTALTKHHTYPVLIAEFGVSTGRGIAQLDANTNRNQGHMSESEQGQALLSCYEDIMDSGCAGGMVFTWQDEWFKRTWNTMHAIDLTRTPYWSDYQTNEQYFGLLSFDPGKDKCISYVDGDFSEWDESDLVYSENNRSLYMKQDERYLYFYIEDKDFDFENDKLDLLLDITPNSGSNNYQNIYSDRPIDFVLEIDGKDNTQLYVQQRYDVLRATYSEAIYHTSIYFKENMPAIDSDVFYKVEMLLQYSRIEENDATLFNTGLFRYGICNPDYEEFDSLADFYVNGSGIELKIPYQLLNFSDPSKRMIHDDYFKHYGVESIKIKDIYVGLAKDGETIAMAPYTLKSWGNKPTYHERLKASYYILKEEWTK